ncbi:MAG: proton-conducting transporter membrane subunit [Planctomycetota bacterium]
MTNFQSIWFSVLVASPAAISLLVLALSVIGFRRSGGSNGDQPRLVPGNHWLTRLMGLQAIASWASLFSWLVAVGFSSGRVPDSLPVGSGVTWSLGGVTVLLFDGVSLLMMTLVSSIGWVICRYSMRYLHGERNQHRYFRWTTFTITAVAWMVLSGNLAIFIAGWMATSLGLHRLLLHYPERAAARRAAWTKFSISRIGDVTLILASFLLLSELGSLNFQAMFAAAASLADGTIPLSVQVASALLIVSAITKSAQFPLHTWLPLTMETPTPVSALMHAGIVNAGGFLIIRHSPILSLVPTSLLVLASIGAATVIYAAVVMTTQTSIKKRLAYSTIAQMGFMMLQCGVGAYSAAMLHILAHSMYKAHAFLSSGGAISDAALARTSTARPNGGISPNAILRMLVSLAVLLAIMTTAFGWMGMSMASKPGGWLLGGVLLSGLGLWNLKAAMWFGNAGWTRALSASAMLTISYVVCFCSVDAIVSGHVGMAPSNSATLVVSGFILVGIVLAGWLSIVARGDSELSVSRRVWVHAANGFYLESVLRRVFVSRRNGHASSGPGSGTSEPVTWKSSSPAGAALSRL